MTELTARRSATKGLTQKQFEEIADQVIEANKLLNSLETPKGIRYIWFEGKSHKVNLK